MPQVMYLRRYAPVFACIMYIFFNMAVDSISLDGEDVIRIRQLNMLK